MTISESGNNATDPHTERTNDSGECCRVRGQKATSERCAMTASEPRTDSGVSADVTVTRLPDPSMTDVFPVRS